MRILLIGNFAPPYEEESLHNFTLLNMLREEENECSVINISENPSQEHGIINTKGYFDFIFKLIRYGWKRDVIHILTKGYTRIVFLRFMIAILSGKILRAKSIGTLYPEMFSVFVQSRSPMPGIQAMYVSFYAADKIICSDEYMSLASTKYKTKDNFEVIPSVIQIPEDISEDKLLSLKKLENKEKIIVFSNMRYPSFLFDVLNNFATKHLSPEIGVAVSLSKISSTEIQNAIEKAGYKSAENLIFIDADDMQVASIAYAKATLILRTLSCDGKTLFDKNALIMRTVARFGNYLYFPCSMLLLREGEIADLCAGMFNNILMRNLGTPPDLSMEDFYERIKNVYSKQKVS
jgi:hypothetical protein